MEIKAPILDDRKSEDIYKQSLELAKHYCPEWADKNWTRDYFDPDDAGLVILKLFSKMTEHLIAQFNKVPDKHRIAFLDFMGIDLLPAQPSRVPLTFYLAEGAPSVYVPPATMVAYQPPKASEVVFETTKGLAVMPARMSAVFSLNPWEDRYTDHSKAVSGKEEGFMVFGRDADEKPLGHVLYLGDDIMFDIRRKAALTIHLETTNQFAILLENYLERWYGDNKLIENPQFTHPDASLQKLDVTMDIQKLEKSSIDGTQSFWLYAMPKEGLEIQMPFNWDEIPGKERSRFMRFITQIYGDEWATAKIKKINDESIAITLGINAISLKLRINENKVYFESKDKTYALPVKKEDGELKIYHLPEISSISVVDITVDGILPDHAFFKDTPLDVKKGFYPFGELPKAGDVLYLGSEEAFSKEYSTIALYIKLKDTLTSDNVKLNWEYWDGRQWSPIGSSIISSGEFSVISANFANGSSSIPMNFTDNTKAFTNTSGKVSFTCPPVAAAEINGQLNRWIRVRIESDGYGAPAAFARVDKVEELGLTADQIKNLGNKGIAFVKYSESTLKPPFIQSVNIEYKYEGKELERIQVYNNFQYNKIEIKDRKFAPFSPYEPSHETLPALYLGFEKDEKITGASISLYFAVKETRYGEEIKEIENPQSILKPVSGFAWEYYNGGWNKFGVEDETDSFTTGGIVSFVIPSNFKSCIEFGKDMYWIRIRPNEANKLACIKLKGVFPNTVWAENSTTVKDEILGSGSGKPDLSLSFSKKPVLEGQVIEVKEEGILSEDEIKVIEAEEGKNALRKVKDEKTGEIKEVWMRWHEVKNFSLSKPLSRHYILDRASGKIIFGDGLRGMMPPKGKNSIVAREYKSGGGLSGNLKSGTITLLKRKIPNIEHVVNHVSSSGGMDQENLESTVDRGPQALKNRNRAVTREDFEWLAYEASQEVARVRCILAGKNISIIIIPESDEDRPLPGAGIIDAVERYLKDRALLTIRRSGRIEVIGPEYEEINIDVTVKLVPSAESITVKDMIKSRLKTFLHPLKGGQKGDGWDFGQEIFISEVAALVESIEGVDYITEIILKEMKTNAVATGVGFITLGRNALPCAGAINAKIG